VFCPQCGHSERDDTRFCTACGKQLLPVARTLPQGKHAGPRTPLLIGIIASIVVFAIMVATAIVGFTASKSAKSNTVKMSTPKEAATQLLLAMQRRDLSNLKSLLDPDFVKKFNETNPGGYESLLEKHFFGNVPGDAEFEDLTFDTSVNGNAATVQLTGGSAHYEDACGNQVKKKAIELLPPKTDLVNRDGGWYVSIPEE
jgi:hypothetical protein